MIITYCPHCKGQYTALDINIHGRAKLSNICSACGKRLKCATRTKIDWRRLFRPSYVDKYWEDIKIIYETSYLPHIDYSVFDQAFRGYLSWHKDNLILRAFTSFKKDGKPFYHIGHTSSEVFGPLETYNTPQLCYMGEEFNPDILYATNRIWDAINIRYTLTKVEGVSPAVLLHTNGNFSRKVSDTRRVVRPKRTILVGKDGFIRHWNKTHGPADIAFSGDLGASVYQAIRVITDESFSPKHAKRDNHAEQLLLTNEELGNACASFPVPFQPDRPKYAPRSVSAVYRPAESVPRLRAVLPGCSSD